MKSSVNRVKLLDDFDACTVQTILEDIISLDSPTVLWSS
jgi:hypothetical protein